MVILAPVDKSERAKYVVREAAELGAAFDERVDVVHVLSRSEFVDLEMTEYEETGTGADMEEVRAAAASIASDAVGNIDANWDSVGLVGDAATQVVTYAENHDARYIVVGPRRRSPTGKVIFGSVAQSILLDAPCPVVTTIQEG